MRKTLSHFPDHSPEIHKDDRSVPSVPESSTSSGGRRTMSRREVFSTTAAIAVVGSVAGPASLVTAKDHRNDGELLALRRLYYAAWSDLLQTCQELAVAQTNQPRDQIALAKANLHEAAALDRLSALENQIASTPASSFDGIWAKADVINKGEGKIPEIEESLRADILAFMTPAGLVAADARSGNSKVAADPVFAALERHRKAYQGYNDVCGLTDAVAARQEGREITNRDHEVTHRAAESERAALDSLIETVPLTIAGVLAFLKYIPAHFDYYDEVDAAIETIAKSPALTRAANA